MSCEASRTDNTVHLLPVSVPHDRRRRRDLPPVFAGDVGARRRRVSPRAADVTGAPTLSFRAVNRSGRYVAGWLAPEHLGPFVETCYRRRWRTLSVVDGAGVEVGRIERPGWFRVWWWQSMIEFPA